MRYREGMEIEQQPKAQVYDGMLVTTALLGLTIALILTWLGTRGRQRWLQIWGGGLVFASLAYLLSFLF